jgi:tryptophan 2,3-dioxygenase
MSQANEAAAPEGARDYESYLALGDVLGAQRPVSQEHDELLFIVIHQVYELWFKQVLHEVAEAQRRLERGEGMAALRVIGRVRAILKTIVGQFDVLETMTPMQFLTFRDRLGTSSGFQSRQFRELERVFGARRSPRDPGRRTLGDSLLAYLVARGHPVAPAALERDAGQLGEPSADVQAVLRDVYRSDPEASEICERLLDLDEGLQEWRYRHVKMVERTIGARTGTGGSPGAEYLRKTLFTPCFPDLWAVRSDL